uniref:Uncharacterized protein n=1 Tax=Aegilops tauschii subsp. strangulata TaxID=200361 RepID=A0A453KAS4_AEGTS
PVSLPRKTNHEHTIPPILTLETERRRASRNRDKSGNHPTQASIPPPSPRQKLEVQKGAREARVKDSTMASADLLRREEEFYESLFDSAKGDAAAAKTRGQMIERKIEALEDMATK